MFVFFVIITKKQIYLIVFQQLLLDKVREKLKTKDSLIDHISQSLEISYDAAHRRVSLKSNFSFHEIVRLAKHFNISLDNLYKLEDRQYGSFEVTSKVENEEQLSAYFESSYNSLRKLIKYEKSRIIYSAKDIPIFYTLNNDRLSHFKIYIWLKLLNPKFKHEKFDNYYPQLSTFQSAKKLGDLYLDVDVIEIWDITTINSTLKQIYFCYKSGELSSETSFKLCGLLKDMLKSILEKVKLNDGKFKLYHNELLLMNNNVLIETSNSKSLYVPLTMLSYCFTVDVKVCNQVREYFDRQLELSKLLNSSGIKEQCLFFNKMFNKINNLQNLIEVEGVLNFE